MCFSLALVDLATSYVATGKKYYFNPATGESSWENPWLPNMEDQVVVRAANAAANNSTDARPATPVAAARSGRGKSDSTPRVEPTRLSGDSRVIFQVWEQPPEPLEPAENGGRSSGSSGVSTPEEPEPAANGSRSSGSSGVSTPEEPEPAANAQGPNANAQSTALASLLRNMQDRAPDGWSAHISKTHGRIYFYSTSTGQTCWRLEDCELEPGPPPGEAKRPQRFQQ
jgi:hypothetical protein